LETKKNACLTSDGFAPLLQSKQDFSFWVSACSFLWYCLFQIRAMLPYFFLLVTNSFILRLCRTCQI